MSGSRHKLTIWGDYFNQDSRVLHALCEMADQEVDFVLIDTLKRENEAEDFRAKNPTQAIPMLTDGNYKILGDGVSIYNFLLMNYPAVKSRFYNSAQKDRVEGLVRHFLTKVRKVTSALIREVALKKVLEKNQQIDFERQQRRLSDFEEFLARYDELLQQSEYLSGPSLTYIDIVVFVEIDTVSLIFNRPIPQTCSKLQSWFDNLAKE